VDGGLIDAPVTVNETGLTNGERAEVVVDFGALPAGAWVAMLESAKTPVMLFQVRVTIPDTLDVRG
jgi:FtsP/CotA-like multicopper oxidase with cupredoxin domain